MTLSLDIVPLTPQQALELAEADDELLQAWLAAYAHPPPTIKNPVAWFLAGVRSGLEPQQALESEHAKDRVLRIEAAERWIRNAGAHLDREDELVAALFDSNGPLKAWVGDDLLVKRLLALWRSERPRGVQCEADRLERAERYKAAKARAGD